RKIFFSRPSPQVKATRRARIRLLIQLARLTEAYSIKTLSEPATAPHAQLVDILQRLAGSGGAPPPGRWTLKRASGAACGKPPLARGPRLRLGTCSPARLPPSRRLRFQRLARN